MDLYDHDIDEFKRIIGITKWYDIISFYAALSIESTKNMILKQQMKLILRAKDNEYVEEFLQQSRLMKIRLEN